MKSRPTHVPTLSALVSTAWNDHAPDAQFSGMTMAQFQAKTQASTDTRDAVTSLTAQRRAKMDELNAADAASRNAIQMVVGAVRSDPANGPDSPLLAAMGYVTRSARKTGKTNKNSKARPTAAAK